MLQHAAATSTSTTTTTAPAPALAHARQQHHAQRRPRPARALALLLHPPPAARASAGTAGREPRPPVPLPPPPPAHRTQRSSQQQQRRQPPAHDHQQQQQSAAWRAAALSELQARLLVCPPPRDLVAALQQLQRVRGGRESVQAVAQQALQHAADLAAAACVTPQQQPSFNAAQVAEVLQAAMHLQLALPQPQQQQPGREQQPASALLGLLQQAAASAAALEGAQLVRLLEGAAWALLQVQQEQEQEQQQAALSPGSMGPAAPLQAVLVPSRRRKKQQRQQHELLERQRLRLLRQQQQRWQQRPASVLQPWQSARLAPVREALAAVLRAWGTAAAAPQQQQHLSTGELSRLLELLHQLQLVPAGDCLLLLSKGAMRADHQQQPHNASPGSAADAAGVLSGLVELAQLVQQQPAAVCVVPAAVVLANGSSSRGRGRLRVSPLVPVLQQHLEQLLLASLSSNGKTAAALSTAMAAVSTLNAMLLQDGALLCTREWCSSSSGGSSSSGSGSSSSSGSGSSSSSGSGGSSGVVPASGLVLTADTLTAVMQAAVPSSRRHEQQQQQQRPLVALLSCSAALLVMRTVGKLCAQQQHAAQAASSSSSTPRAVKPMHLGFWLCDCATAAFKPSGGLQTASAAELAALFGLAAAHRVTLPPWWLSAAESRVGGHIAALSGGDAAVQQEQQLASPQPAVLAAAADVATLLHKWVLLLQAQPKRRKAHAAQDDCSQPGAAASSGSTWHFCRSAWFVDAAAGAFAPLLPHMDAASVGAVSLALSNLHLPHGPQLQAWVQQLLAAAEAVAARAAADSSSSRRLAKPALPAEAVLQVLQALLLLRVQPPMPLLQGLLAAMCQDMLLLRGPVLVQLLMVLTQLRYRPSLAWLGMVLQRLQGKLRMLAFDELTQLCWCLVQMGVKPPQAWQNDLMDAAALPVVAERRRQQQGQAWFKQQQQVTQLAAAASSTSTTSTTSSSSSSGASHFVPRPRGHPRVHSWQLCVMHWAVLRCWAYRSSHAVGKQQWRLVRELNRAVRNRQEPTVPPSLRLIKQQARRGASGSLAAVQRRRRRVRQQEKQQEKLAAALQAKLGLGQRLISPGGGIGSSRFSRVRCSRIPPAWDVWPQQWKLVSLSAGQQ